MSYHPRIERTDFSSLCTTRTRNSELWFINNRGLEQAILGYLAKYSKRYEVQLYAFAVEGNHVHALAQFPNANRASFKRDLNSSIARAVPRFSDLYTGGRLWARRYSCEFIPEPEDIEEYFFYTVLQPVKDGLVDKISEYPGYNCFHDAVNGITRKFEVINWTAYNEKKRWTDNVYIKDFKENVYLTYKRLPGYEGLTQKEYRSLMYKKLEERRVEIIAKRECKKSVGTAALKQKKPGSRPYQTKISSYHSHRPRVLCKCPVKRHECLRWYFSVYFRYKECSEKFRAGDNTVIFPEGTYKPPHYQMIHDPPK